MRKGVNTHQVLYCIIQLESLMDKKIEINKQWLKRPMSVRTHFRMIECLPSELILSKQSVTAEDNGKSCTHETDESGDTIKVENINEREEFERNRIKC